MRIFLTKKDQVLVYRLLLIYNNLLLLSMVLVPKNHFDGNILMKK